MPKNKINLNSLPLGDLPDGGLIILSGDKVTIRDRVIIYETVENGKKVVKLYRQVDGPQQIQPAPISEQQQQGIKRSGSPLPPKPVSKRKKSAISQRQQPTADQQRRQQEISVERKRISEELKECAAERQALKNLTANNPHHHDIASRSALNRTRMLEAEKRARDIGILRRALNSELNLKNEYGDDWGQEVEDDMVGSQQYNSFGQPFMQSHATLFNEHGSDPNKFGYGSNYSHFPAFQDQLQQSYAGAPGFQSQPGSLFRKTVTQYPGANTDALTENKIHPSRLTLMNSDTAVPERYSTEPKVLMKVTGENMVPLVRSRMGSRSIKKTVKPEPEAPILREKVDVSSDRNSPVNSWENLKRGYGQMKKESITISDSQLMSHETSMSDDAIAWLDANIPLKEDPAPVQQTGQVDDPIQWEEDFAEQRCVRDSAAEQAHDESVIIKLGLQRYRGVDATQVLSSSQEVSISQVHAENIVVKLEPGVDVVHAAVAKNEEQVVFIKPESMVDHSTAPQYIEDLNVIIKKEQDTQLEIDSDIVQKENMAIKLERVEHGDRSICIEATINGKMKDTELPQRQSPNKLALGDLSVNIAGRKDENEKETE
ncbi:hypothetical protein IFR05_013122 [Cadophora sp. M221]|nr:hypothetical protein IFR05_013122 [Cadophora sp. M221]